MSRQALAGQTAKASKQAVDFLVQFSKLRQTPWRRETVRHWLQQQFERTMTYADCGKVDNTTQAYSLHVPLVSAHRPAIVRFHAVVAGQLNKHPFKVFWFCFVIVSFLSHSFKKLFKLGILRKTGSNYSFGKTFYVLLQQTFAQNLEKLL